MSDFETHPVGTSKLLETLETMLDERDREFDETLRDLRNPFVSLSEHADAMLAAFEQLRARIADMEGKLASIERIVAFNFRQLRKKSALRRSTITCPTCLGYGEGKTDGSYSDIPLCPECGGSGKVTMQQRDESGKKLSDS